MSDLIGFSKNTEAPRAGNENTAPSSADSGAAVVDGSEATFNQDVIEASMQTPVIVDFWAPWCGPCKQISPALEGAVNASGGKVRLVKINFDENQGIAAQLRIQSIPTVYAFFEGQPVDGFQGAVPDSQIKEFVEKLSGLAGQDETEMLDAALAQADQLIESGQAQEAQAILQQLFSAMPENPAIAGKLAKTVLSLNGVDEATAFIESLPETLQESEEISAVKASLALSQEASGLASLAELKQRSEAKPDDLNVRFELARGYIGAGEREAAADHLLGILQKDREWDEGKAKDKLLELFSAYGHTDSFTVAYRKKLSALLFS